MDNVASFGQWLRAQRRVQDLTREALARQVGCAVVTIKKIEADERRPSRHVAERLLAVLKVPPPDHTAIMRLARATPVLDQPPPVTPPKGPNPRDSENLSGQIVKGYELHERIGSGGFGAVYRAVQTSVGREVAVKVILARYADHPDFIRRFEAEAQIIARLEHPHIIPLYDYWREPGGAYLVMRYLRAGNLHVSLGKELWSLERIGRLLDHIAPALHCAHQRGVVHRDVKPVNILLDTAGNAYLADFGIAKDLWAADQDGLTQTGAVVGSPAYLSPEQIRDEAVTPQTDIYSLGIVVYELLTSSHPFANLTPAQRLAKQLNEPLPALGLTRPDLPVAYNAIIQRATAKQPTDRYPDVLQLLADWQRAAALPVPAPLPQPLVTTVSINTPPVPGEPAPTDAVLPQAATAPTATDDAAIENPYKGLRAFVEADAADFFGRTALTGRLLERLAEEQADARFLAVVGPSGSGKSSVVRAGLIPALRQGGLPGSEQWFIVDIVPGTHPLEELEIALLKVAAQLPIDLLPQLERDSRGLLRAARLVLPNDDASELVLVVDQFEELWTLITDGLVRERFLDLLVTAVTDPRSRVRVIVTLRADFYDRPLQHGGLGELMRTRSEVVLPLTPDELEQAIVEPAMRAGLTLEPGLAAAIVGDVVAQPGALPLLQYALTELFERRAGRVLTMDAYRAIEGVDGALTRRADELYGELDDAQQAAAHQLLLRLVALGEGSEDTRRRVRLSELSGVGVHLEAVRETFGRYRLLTFDRDPLTREPTVEVAHEALLRSWGRLRGWLAASRDDLRVQRRLAAAAQEWAQSRQDPSYLMTGARLAQFETLAATSNLALSDEETLYLHRSLHEHQRQTTTERERQERELALQQRAANRLRWLVGALALFLIVAIGLSVFAFNRQAAALTNLTRSEAQRLAAEANALAQAHGVAEVIGLLSIRSMTLQYSPQGDAALAEAATLDYPWQRFVSHDRLISSVAFSFDGTYVLTGSDDKSARLWDTETGDQLRQFVGHSEGVNAVAFSPDGKYVLTGSTDTTARLWDSKSGISLQTFSGHTSSVNAATFSPDGQYVLTGGSDNTARLWDIETGSVIQTFTGHTELVVVVTFSPDGKQVLTGSFDQTARLWDTQTGRELHSFSHHTGVVQGVAFSPNGANVLTNEGNTILLWDIQSGQELRQFVGHTNDVRHIAFSPDGRSVLSGSDDETVRLWDIQTGRELRRFSGHTGVVFSVAFSPDGQYALSGSLDNTALLWNLRAHPQSPSLLGHTGVVLSVSFSPDGRYAITGSGDTTARLWDTRTGVEQRVFTTSDIVTSVAISPDGRQVLTGGFDKIARLWNIDTGVEVRQFVGHNNYLNSVTFSPDGKYVLTGSGDREARLWDVKTGAEVRQFVGHQYDNIFAVSFSPDSQYALTGSYDGTARLWDVQTGKQVRVFSIPNDGASAVAFSPDGAQVLTGSWDGVVRLWDAQTGQEVRRFTGHTAIVWDVAFSPDGKHILTGSEDRTMRLWDAQTGQEVRRFTGHTGTVNGVAFSPDGRKVLTGSSDSTARLWDIDYHDTIAYLCRRLLRDFSDDERAQYGITAEPTCPNAKGSGKE